MPTHIKIKTDSDNLTHFDFVVMDYTLCGLDTMGDEKLGISQAKVVKSRVNCPQCIAIVEFCHKIKPSDFKTKQP